MPRVRRFGAEPPSRAAVYALAIRTLAEQIGKPADSWPVLYVKDHACASAADAPGVHPFDPESIRPGLRDDIVAALRDYAPVTFVATDENLFDDQLQIRDGGAIVTLGTAPIDGATARVPLGIVGSGGLNAQGLTYTLRQENGTWRITGTTGSMWMA